MVRVSTPSRLCLFGEHQDYLELEVIAAAIDLRFCAKAEPATDGIVRVRIRDSAVAGLGEKNVKGLYQNFAIDLSQPITYRKKRDYFLSAIKVLRDEGFELRGANIMLDANIPIRKGMCSSTTMVLAYITALAALSDPARVGDARYMAHLAWRAEVEEFDEPGGKMDHYTSAAGGIVHIDFAGGETVLTPLDVRLDGCFILFDSLQPKDTLNVLSASKLPALEALQKLEQYGVTGIRQLAAMDDAELYVNKLEERLRGKLRANIDNYRIQREALSMLRSNDVDDRRLGDLLNRHHENLRSGLGISTPTIDLILETALANGAYGGKFNGSGGGGCLYVYAPRDKADGIMAAVTALGYPAMLLKQDGGLRVDCDA